MGGLAGVGFIACSRHLGIARREAPERSNGAVSKCAWRRPVARESGIHSASAWSTLRLRRGAPSRPGI